MSDKYESFNAALSSLQGEAVEVKSLIERLHRCCEHAAEYCDTEHYHQSCARVDMAFWQLFPNATQLFTYPPDSAAKIAEQEARIKELESELAEQSRLLGISAERDLALQARLAEVKKDAERWNLHVKLASQKLGVQEEDLIKEIDIYIDEAIDAAIQESKKGGAV